METQACIDAILNDSCDVVRAPETHPACAFLIPDPAASAPPPDQAAPDSGLATPDATVVFDAAPVFDAGR